MCTNNSSLLCEGKIDWILQPEASEKMICHRSEKQSVEKIKAQE